MKNTIWEGAICQSLGKLSTTNRYDFFYNDIFSREKEILSTINFKENISDIFTYSVGYHSLKSQNGDGLKALRTNLDKFFSPYIQPTQTLFTYKQHIDVINDIISRSYKEAQSCTENLSITILISNKDLKTYLHRDTEAGEHTAKIVIPLLGESTVFVPYNDILYKNSSNILPNQLEKAPANHGTCFISKGFSSAIHSQPETDAARIIVFLGPADIQNSLDSNDANLVGVASAQEL